MVAVGVVFINLGGGSGRTGQQVVPVGGAIGFALQIQLQALQLNRAHIDFTLDQRKQLDLDVSAVNAGKRRIAITGCIGQ